MPFDKRFTSSCLIVGLLAGLGFAEQSPNLTKRTALLQERSRCENPDWIPACPVGLPCLPPGGICCSDGITYVMPPDTCPDGTEPVGTAIVSSPPSSTAAPSASSLVKGSASASYSALTPYGTGAYNATGTGGYYPPASSSIVPANGQTLTVVDLKLIGAALLGAADWFSLL